MGIVLTLVFISIMICNSAFAETSRYFIGLGAGESHIVEDETYSVFFVPGQNLNDRVDIRSVYFGYKMNEAFSLEIGRSNLDSAHKFYELRTDILPALPPYQYEELDIEQTYISAILSSPY